MKYLMTFVWSLLLVTMLNYVTGSIANIPFDFIPGAILSVVLAVFVIIISASLPKDPVADH